MEKAVTLLVLYALAMYLVNWMYYEWKRIYK